MNLSGQAQYPSDPMPPSIRLLFTFFAVLGLLASLAFFAVALRLGITQGRIVRAGQKTDGIVMDIRRPRRIRADLRNRRPEFGMDHTVVSFRPSGAEKDVQFTDARVGRRLANFYGRP